MFSFKLSTEEKTSKVKRHKNLEITFKKKDNKLVLYILKLIKSFF